MRSVSPTSMFNTLPGHRSSRCTPRVTGVAKSKRSRALAGAVVPAGPMPTPIPRGSGPAEGMWPLLAFSFRCCDQLARRRSRIARASPYSNDCRGPDSHPARQVRFSPSAGRRASKVRIDELDFLGYVLIGAGQRLAGAHRSGTYPPRSEGVGDGSRDVRTRPSRRVPHGGRNPR